MNDSQAAKASLIEFDQLKKFADHFVQLFHPIDTKNAQKKFSAVLAVSEAVLHWYLAPVVEVTENGAENCAIQIKRLVDTVIGHVDSIQQEKILFSFTREALAGLDETAQSLKIVAEQKEIEIFNQDKALVWRFAVFFADEDEKTETLQIAAV